jgi:hypothetical protein
MAVVFEHLLRDVSGDIHNGLVTRTTFRQLRNERVPVVVPATGHLGIFADIAPGRLQRRDGTCGIAGPRFSEREDVPLRSNLVKSVRVLCNVLRQRREQSGVQRDGAALATLRLAAAHSKEFLCKVDLRPSQRFDLGISHTGIQRQR